jgi:hypothetical protein
MYAKKRRKTVELKKVTWKKRGQKRGQKRGKSRAEISLCPNKSVPFFTICLCVVCLFLINKTS